MWCRLFHCLAAFLLLIASATPVLAQPAPPPPGAEGEEKPGGATNALPTVVAVLSGLLVLVIICKPSRKS